MPVLVDPDGSDLETSGSGLFLRFYSAATFPRDFLPTGLRLTGWLRHSLCSLDRCPTFLRRNTDRPPTSSAHFPLLGLYGFSLRRFGVSSKFGVSGTLRCGHLFAGCQRKLFALSLAAVRWRDGYFFAAAVQHASEFGNLRIYLGLLRLEPLYCGLNNFWCECFRHVFIFESLASKCQVCSVPSKSSCTDLCQLRWVANYSS